MISLKISKRNITSLKNRSIFQSFFMMRNCLSQYFVLEAKVSFKNFETLIFICVYVSLILRGIKRFK